MKLDHFTYRGSDGLSLHAWASTDLAQRDSVPIVHLHGGGPDHRSMVPLAERLQELGPQILPDIRGYGRSVCREPERHTWAQYVSDLLALLDALGRRTAVVVGAGIGTTIALRTAKAHPDRLAATVLISLEDIEDDEAKAKEVEYLARFADTVRRDGLDAAWAPVLGHFPPVIAKLVREAIPRADRDSIAAAAAIGYDRSFRSVEELAGLSTATFVIPGDDPRHPPELASRLVSLLPNGQLSTRSFGGDLTDANDMGRAFAPLIAAFLRRATMGG